MFCGHISRSVVCLPHLTSKHVSHGFIMHHLTIIAVNANNFWQLDLFSCNASVVWSSLKYLKATSKLLKYFMYKKYTFFNNSVCHPEIDRKLGSMYGSELGVGMELPQNNPTWTDCSAADDFCALRVARYWNCDVICSLRGVFYSMVHQALVKPW